MEAGKSLKLVLIPRTAVLGYAEAPKAQPLRFQDKVFGG
jgi:hypothetical protein